MRTITFAYRMMSGVAAVIALSAFSFLGLSDSKDRKPRRLAQEEYIQWIESKDSRLRIRMSHGVLDFSLVYKPLDYIVCKEQGGATLSKEEARLRKKEREALEYYTFTISLNDGRKDLIKSLTQNSLEYESLLLYLATDMQQDLKLVRNNDTSACRLFHMERAYGITPYVRFVIGFESASSRKSERSDRVVLFDGHMFGMNVQSLRLREEDIHSIPKVDYKG